MFVKCCYSLLAVFLMLPIPYRHLVAQVIPVAPAEILPAVEEICSEEINSLRPLPYFNKYDILSDYRLGEPFPYLNLMTEVVYLMEDNARFKDALELIGWKVPIYLGSVETEPRTYIQVKMDTTGVWHFHGAGGDPLPIQRARKKWPIEEGYRHALLRFSTTNLFLIILEKEDNLNFWFYLDDDQAGDWLLKLTRNTDGSWPTMSLGQLINIIQSNVRYSKKHKGLH